MWLLHSAVSSHSNQYRFMVLNTVAAPRASNSFFVTKVSENPPNSWTVNLTWWTWTKRSRVFRCCTICLNIPPRCWYCILFRSLFWLSTKYILYDDCVFLHRTQQQPKQFIRKIRLLICARYRRTRSTNSICTIHSIWKNENLTWCQTCYVRGENRLSQSSQLVVAIRAKGKIPPKIV